MDKLNYLAQTIICMSITFFMFISLFLSFNYSYEHLSYNLLTPYGLSGSYLLLHQDDAQIPLASIIDPAIDNDVTILSEDLNSSTLGIYDPRFYFHFEASVIAQYGKVRYFSPDDYINSTYAYIESIDTLYAAYSYYYGAPNESKQLLYVIDPSNKLYDSRIEETVNLMYLGHFSDNVYLDADDPGDYLGIQEKLIDYGYHIEEKILPSPITLLLTVLSHYQTAMLIVSTFALYMIFMLTVNFHFYTNQKLIRSHIVHGGKIGLTLWHLSKPFIIMNTASSFVYLLIYEICFPSNSFIVLNLSQLIRLFIFHWLFTSVVFIAAAFINYRQVALNLNVEVSQNA